MFIMTRPYAYILYYRRASSLTHRSGSGLFSGRRVRGRRASDQFNVRKQWKWSSSTEPAGCSGGRWTTAAAAAVDVARNDDDDVYTARTGARILVHWDTARTRVYPKRSLPLPSSAAVRAPYCPGTILGIPVYNNTMNR